MSKNLHAISWKQCLDAEHEKLAHFRVMCIYQPIRINSSFIEYA